ncbi:MAG TPA: ATP-grasp domain-containing protein [Burkholderiales bacterium]|nr:ATP-grasp domain-containing protein [Burkholderiales bacterium]
MTPPVVLLGGLDIVRALGLARIPVIIASLERRTPAMASRYCTGTIALPPGTGRDALVDALVRAGRWLAAQYGARVPLFYDNDDRLALVQDYRDALGRHFALLLNEPALADALLDKARFQALAESRGLPVPRPLAWDALAEEPGPVLVKPKVRLGWDHSAVREQLFGGAGKARVFASGRAAYDDGLVRQLAAQLTFQEYLPGDDSAIWSFHGFAAPGGAVLASFVGRKIRTYPALTGDSAYLRLAREPELERLGREIVARLGLAGVFKMDFKRSAANGRLYLLEINARFNLWHHLGAKNGLNLPRVAYDYLVHERRPRHLQASETYRWLSFSHERRAYRELAAAGKLGAVRWLWSLLQAPKVYAIFSWTDPAPFVRYWRGRLSRRLRRLWHSTAS